MFQTDPITDIDGQVLAVGDRVLHFGGTRGTWYRITTVRELRPTKEMSLVVDALNWSGDVVGVQPIRSKHVVKVWKQND